MNIYNPSSHYEHIKNTFSKELQYLEKNLSKKRLDHSIKTSYYAFYLAKKYEPQNIEKALLAGLLHDLTKEKPIEYHLNLLPEDILANVPNQAYHAYSGAISIEKDLGIYNFEIKQAIATHTLGSANLNCLQKIIYCSDMLGSDYFENLEDSSQIYLQMIENLNFGVFFKSKKTITLLLKNEKKIHQNTIDTYNNSLKYLVKDKYPIAEQ